ncbi:MAG: hypothetical protein HY283_03925 [Nitrospirae bacterium]|nr:hypothetical protein [Nitrospirota bacterium]
MNVPRDQGLFFTVFFGFCLGIVLTVWMLLPVYHRGEEEPSGAPKPVLFSPEERIRRSEQAINRVETVLSQLKATQKEKLKKPLSSKPKAGS